MRWTAPSSMAEPWRNRIVGSGEEDPAQLLANPANWRIHPRTQQKALAGALDEVGWVQQVMVNQRTGYVVDGHARVAIAISRGEPKVPVLYVDLDEAEEKVVLATLDPVAAMAGTDSDMLRDLLSDISVADEDLALFLEGLGHPDGYSEQERLEAWGGMPAFEQEDQTGYGSVIVHFATAEDMDAFAHLVDQAVGPRTKSIWFPESELEPLSTKRIVVSQ